MTGPADAAVVSAASATTAGVLLLSVVGIAYGGTFLLQLVGGAKAATDFQRSWFRAGHAHAGVLVLLSLVVLLYLDGAGLDGPLAATARALVPLSAILVPAGFFLGATGRGRTSANPFRWLLAAGGVTLCVGVGCLGVALLLA